MPRVYHLTICLKTELANVKNALYGVITSLVLRSHDSISKQANHKIFQRYLQMRCRDCPIKRHRCLILIIDWSALYHSALSFSPSSPILSASYCQWLSNGIYNSTLLDSLSLRVTAQHTQPAHAKAIMNCWFLHILFIIFRNFVSWAANCFRAIVIRIWRTWI